MLFSEGMVSFLRAENIRKNMIGSKKDKAWFLFVQRRMGR